MNHIFIEIITTGEQISVPKKMTSGSAGFDLTANIDGSIVIQPGERQMIPTGIKLGIPKMYEGQIRPRSGLAWQYGITVLNSPGTIDSDYRGEIKVVLVNLGTDPFTLSLGDRIAQLVIQKLPEVSFLKVERLTDTGRGEGGFGHTNIKNIDKTKA